MREAFNQHFQNLTDKDKTCETCVYLTVNKPSIRPRGTTLNAWADEHVAVCNQYNIAWTCGNGQQVRRCFECIVLQGKTIE